VVPAAQGASHGIAGAGSPSKRQTRALPGGTGRGYNGSASSFLLENHIMSDANDSCGVRLCACRAGFAVGIVWGLGCALLGLVTIFTERYAHDFVEVLGSIYWGFRRQSGRRVARPAVGLRGRVSGHLPGGRDLPCPVRPRQVLLPVRAVYAVVARRSAGALSNWRTRRSNRHRGRGDSTACRRG
jgi:hypothetical protein